MKTKIENTMAATLAAAVKISPIFLTIYTVIYFINLICLI